MGSTKLGVGPSLNSKPFLLQGTQNDAGSRSPIESTQNYASINAPLSPLGLIMVWGNSGSVFVTPKCQVPHSGAKFSCQIPTSARGGGQWGKTLIGALCYLWYFLMILVSLCYRGRIQDLQKGGLTLQSSHDQPYGAARWNALWHTAQHAKLKLGGSGGMPPQEIFLKNGVKIWQFE